MISPLLQLCRLYYAIPMSLAYLLTVYYARGGVMTSHWLVDGLSTAAVTLAIAAAYVLNDVLDREVDKINCPHRPLPSGKVHPKTAAALAAVLTASALIASAACSMAFLAAVFALLVGLVAYDVFSKRLGAFKQIAVAVLMSSYYPLAVIQAGGITAPRGMSLLVFPAWLLLTAWGYELFKDLRDRLGDPPINQRPTFLQRHPERWTRIAGLAVAAASPMLVVPILLGCKWVYLIGAMVAIALAFASSKVPVRTAIKLIYLECFIAALAAALDVAILGI